MTTTVGGKGVYNAVCDVCGFKFKNYQLKKRWDGFMVCKDDWETRHPMDFYKVRNDEHSIPWSRPERELQLGPPNLGLANVAVAGIAIAGKSP